MTETEYRNDPAMRKELMEALEKPALQLAIAIIKAQGEGDDAVLGAPEVASIRLLSQRCGRDAGFRKLFQMALPIPHEEPAPAENFGTEFTVDQFDIPPEEVKTP